MPLTSFLGLIHKLHKVIRKATAAYNNAVTEIPYKQIPLNNHAEMNRYMETVLTDLFI